MRVTCLIILLLALVGCASLKLQPIMNFDDQPVAEGVSAESFGKVLMATPARRGWVFQQIEPGLFRGTLLVRSHTAVVDVRFAGTTYSVHYYDSTNLGYTGSDIHRNYNRWVINLNQDIRQGLLQLAAGVSPTPAATPPPASTDSQVL